MRDILSFALVAFPSLIVILNPLLVTSVFITLTAESSKEVKSRVIRKTTLVAFMVLIVFALFGTVIFKIFGITIGAFQIAGGILLFSVAMGMLHARTPRIKHTPEEMEEALGREDIAVVPLAIPILSGPGAITTVIVLGGESRSIPNILVLFGSIVASMVVVYVMLRNATRVQRFLGTSGINIATRLMGLVLAAIAVQFVVHGIESVLPEIVAVLEGTPRT